MFRVLVVDDDADLRLSVSHALSSQNFEVAEARDGEEALLRVRSGKVDLVLLDVQMPKLTGLQALREIKAHDPSIIVIMLTAFSNVRDAVEATKQGAFNYLEKPIKADNLVYLVEQALKARKMVQNMSYAAPRVTLQDGTEFIGQTAEMKRIFDICERLARVDTPVLIRGESGTGKELVAKALHFMGPRKNNPFVTINCSAIPETLMETEFFGHEKGAFTGADSRKIGKFQYADGGTLFLDEIGDITPAMQVKLLRAIQERTFTPVGSNREVEVDVRILAATNRNLEEMIANGTFREDLFYRLNVLPITLPPLRERPDDIEILVGHFIATFNQEHQKNIKGLAPGVLQILKDHRWPGNIRELENVIEHAFVMEPSELITAESLPETVIEGAAEAPDEAGTSTATKAEPVIAGEILPGARGFSLDVERLDYHLAKEEFEKQFLISALKAFKGRINQTALHANIPKKTLLRKLLKYGIRARDYSGG